MEVENWIEQSFDNPVPVHLTLDLIVNVLTKQHFPNDEKIAKKRAGLLKALANYCQTILKPAGHVSTCEPVEDPVPPSDDFQCVKLGKMALTNISNLVSKKTGLPEKDFIILPTSFNSKIYLVGKEQVSRLRGNEPCRRLTKGSMKLAIFERESEFNCISMGLSSINQLVQPSFWVGMVRDYGHVFSWENGAPFTYTLKWGRNEPNNQTKWNRYRSPVSSEDFVILWDEKSYGTVDSLTFNDVAESADWPFPLCESQFHRFEISTNFKESERDPVGYGEAIMLRNQKFGLTLKGPLSGLSHYATLESENKDRDENRRHCQFHGNWQLEEKGWFYEKWKKDRSRDEVHFGDIVQISNNNGNPVLDAAGSFSFGDVENGWREATDDLWRIQPCYPFIDKLGDQIKYDDRVLFENVYFTGNYLYAYQQILTSKLYLSSSNAKIKRQIWKIERLDD